MGQMIYDFTKASLIKASNNKELFVKELVKASKALTKHEKDKITNWLFFFTADKPDMQKWVYELLDKDILVG
ncbi:MAG: hypothetical protein M0D53_15300 [Flavobacterium sp. JAD_PAG50586_2]|nr:MAG: hypothetical protein M0D53_15300 [Flavobacterium sp. JAD_PAG50586_2]